MPRGLLFRLILAGISIFTFVAAAFYAFHTNFADLLLYITTLLSSLVAIIGFLWAILRYSRQNIARGSQPTTDKPLRDIDAYHEGRLRQFEEEAKLFVELAGDTIIQTAFSSESHQFENIEEAVELHKGRFVLVGEPGTGKSTTLRKLMIQAIHDYRLRTNPRLPVWINLGLSTKEINADDLLQFWWDEQAYLPGTPDQHIKQDAVWLFMDGLNEMPLDSREERAQALKVFLDKHPTLPVIVTCRVRDYEDDENLNLGLPMVRVHELDDGRIQEFISKRGASTALWEKIRSNDALRRMADNPYKLVMLIAVYQARREPPERLDELYGLYVKEAYRTYKDEREKVENTPLLRLTWPKLETQLKRLAFLMIKDGKGTAATLDWARRKIGKRALMDGINLGVLLVDGEDVKFYHQSLHGFFAVEKLGQVLNIEGKSKDQLQEVSALIRQIGDMGEAGSPAVGALIKVAKATSIPIRARAINALGRIGDKRALETLIEALDDFEGDVRQMAIKALGRMVDERAVAQLKNLVYVGRGRTQRNVVASLEQIGKSAVETLCELVGDIEPNLACMSAAALGRIRDPRACQALIRVLRDDKIRPTAVEALEKIGAPAVDSLIEELTDADPILKEIIIELLGRIGDRRSVSALIDVLEDDHVNVTCRAAAALGRIEDNRAVKPLIGLLEHPYWRVREAAAIALGQIGERHAVKPLISLLGDSDWEVRIGAIVSLGTLKDNFSVSYLVSALGNIDRDLREAEIRSDVSLSLGSRWKRKEEYSYAIYSLRKDAVRMRVAIFKALGEIGDIRSLDLLIRALHDRELDVPVSAIYDALALFGEPAVDALIGLLHDPDLNLRLAATHALGTIGDRCAVDPLIGLLHDPDLNLRLAATHALGTIGDRCAVDPLIGLLHDPDLNLRLAATHALGIIRDSHAVKPLIHLLEDPNRNMRKIAAQALGEIGDTNAVDPLIGLLHDSNWTVRKVAVQALGVFGDRRAVEPLILLLGQLYPRWSWEWDMLRVSAQTLAFINDVRAIRPLKEALSRATSLVDNYQNQLAMDLRTIGTDVAIAAVEQWEMENG